MYLLLLLLLGAGYWATPQLTPAYPDTSFSVINSDLIHFFKELL